LARSFGFLLRFKAAIALAVASFSFALGAVRRLPLLLGQALEPTNGGNVACLSARVKRATHDGAGLIGLEKCKSRAMLFLFVVAFTSFQALEGKGMRLACFILSHSSLRFLGLLHIGKPSFIANQKQVPT
jgi:hypothetical protein